MATARRQCVSRADGFRCQLGAPSRVGPTDEQLWAEARRLVELAWSLDEIRARLELPALQ